MGFRNPFRISVDKETGYVYVADYGPDAGGPSATRGPGGQVEYSVLRAPGNFGWPYCTGDNDAFNDYNFATGQSGALFNCAAPVNTSPNNTGLQNLPASVLPDIWYGNGGPWEAEMQPGGSESPMGGPVYHYDASNPSETKFPAYYDDHWFPYEWGRDWIKETALDAPAARSRSAPSSTTPCSGGRTRWTWSSGPTARSTSSTTAAASSAATPAPRSTASTTCRAAGGRSPWPAPTRPRPARARSTVQFSSEGSRDPDGGVITYSWDFGDGSPVSTEPNPTHTYNAVGTYRATLTVTDDTGKTGTDDVQIVVGNAAPVITVSSPAEGGFFDFGDQIPYDVTVTDAEDGTISGTHADCSRVEIDYLLGHDEHAHPLTDATGCQGTIQTAGEAGHGADANTFGVLAAAYTDKGGAPGAGPLRSDKEVVIWPKLLQAEHFTDMRGIQTVAQAERRRRRACRLHRQRGRHRAGQLHRLGPGQPGQHQLADRHRLLGRRRRADPGPARRPGHRPAARHRQRAEHGRVGDPAGLPAPDHASGRHAQAVLRVPERRAGHGPDPLQRARHLVQRAADGRARRPRPRRAACRSRSSSPAPPPTPRAAR